MSADALAGILDALGAAPDLPGCACAGRHELFDRTISTDRTGPGGAAELAEVREACMNICLGCPELIPCRAWVDGLTRSKKPLGVCGGRLHSPKQPIKENIA